MEGGRGKVIQADCVNQHRMGSRLCGLRVAPKVVSALVAQAAAAFSRDPALGWLEQIMAVRMASDLRDNLRGGAGRHCGRLLNTIWGTIRHLIV